MKLLISLLLLCSSMVAMADKPPTVIVVPQPTEHHAANTTQVSNISMQVLQQQIQDLANAETRRDNVEQMLIQGLDEKVNGGASRIDRLESQAATIETVGGLALTLLLAFAGWSISVSSDRHKENRETNQQIAHSIQALSTAVAVIESKLGVSEHK